MSLALVTGGAGFVGKPLVEQLRARGERVRSFDLAAPSHGDDLQGSITDISALKAAMRDVDCVFHLAGNAQLWSRDRTVFDYVNRVGTERVVAAAQEAGVSRLVHCSSLTTLVGRSTPVGPSSADETVHLPSGDMLGAYPGSKREAELIVERAAEDGLNASIALPTEPLGPGDEAMTPPTRMILDFARGATPAYIDCVLNFVPVESLAQGLIAVRDRGERGEKYLLGGENTPLRALVQAIAELSGRAAPRARMPYWVALAAGVVETHGLSALTGKPPKAPLTGVRLAGRQVSFSSEKAARDLDWRAAPFEPALARTIDWFRETGRL